MITRELPAAVLTIRLFGPLEVCLNGGSLPALRFRKSQWLLALLVLRHGRAVERDWLCGLLWPDSADRQALRNSLANLRQALGPEAVRLRSPSPQTLSLDLSGAAVDVPTFDAAIERGDPPSLRSAVDLYRGPLLEGCSEEWVFQEREARQQAYLTARERLATLALQAGEAGEAERHLRLAVAADPFRESSQRVLMRTLAASGNYAAALHVYRELRQHLHRELNTVPDAETQALFEQLRSEARHRSANGASAALPGVEGPHGRSAARRSPVDAPPAAWGARRNVAPIAAPRLSRADHGMLALPAEPAGITHAAEPEPAGGAVPLDSLFYIARPTDEWFAAAIERGDSIVLVKGPRQVGKTSLLARGLQRARQAGARVVLTDLEILNAAHLASAEAFLLALAHSVAEQLDLPVSPLAVWDPQLGANPSFRRFLRREVLEVVDTPLVWGLNDVDRLFSCDFGSEIFALFRSWHNERALDPAGPWSRLTLAMVYTTEAHLFITDLNKSPFNVGTRLPLEDFTFAEVAELNRRYGSPLPDDASLTCFCELVGGHPYLVRRGLDELAARAAGMAEFEARAAADDGIFGDHLQRLFAALARDPELCEVVREILAGRRCRNSRSFYRLRSAGVLTGESEADARPRCRLYATYLARYLR